MINGEWLWGLIAMTFFDKMSFHGAIVKIKSGMVRRLIPCVLMPNK